MIPVVTPEEMAAVDAAAPEPVEDLIRRAGAHVHWEALDLLGGAYGRRIVVVAGKGNNGNDGRDAARRLRRAGARVIEIDAADPPKVLPPSDLVIDAAYGTGFSGTWHPPDTGGAPVLAVDIPTGVDGLTGECHGEPWAAVRTVTFQALKPGLLFEPGASRCGQLVVADIGLDLGDVATGVVTAADVAERWPARPRGAHKWTRAVYVAGGSPGMAGAAGLVAHGALRAGAGMVRVGSRAPDLDTVVPTEAVSRQLPPIGWGDAVLGDLDRFHVLVIGPGLGRDETTVSEIRRVLASAPIPAVVDADALFALEGSRLVREIVDRRARPTILTPHEGEFARLFGSPFGPDRIGAAGNLAADTGAVVLLKGPTTIVAAPDLRCRLITNGDARLATAGTGDVLAGVVGAAVASGLDAFDAAACGAWVHAAAARECPIVGLVAGDVADAVPAVLDRVMASRSG
jgi:NAD(P)H-hydrate epimerase